MRTRRRSTLALVLVVSVALTGAVMAAPAGSAATTKLKTPAVKLMLITELSAGVTTPELPNGAKAAVKALNKAGGIDGYQATLTVCDTKNDPNVAAACGQQAVDGKYLAVVGSQSVQASKYFPILQAAGIPSVGNNAADASDFTNPSSFPLTGGLISTIGGLASALAESGAKKISTGYIDVPQGALIPLAGNVALQRFGLEFQNKVAIPVGAPDLSSYVEAATANGTDGILLAITGQDAINFIQNYISSGKTGAKFALITTDAAAVLKAIKGQNLTFFGAASYTRLNKQYLADMKAAGYNNPVGQEIVSYAAVEAVAKAAQGLPTLDAPSLLAKLPTITDLDLGSIMPIVNFTQAGKVIPGTSAVATVATRVSNVCVKTSKLGKSDFVIISKTWYNAYTGDKCQAG
jgi:ABC-type branched-subunit amino acid transport system substrate-binding protein